MTVGSHKTDTRITYSIGLWGCRATHYNKARIAESLRHLSQTVEQEHREIRSISLNHQDGFLSLEIEFWK